MNSIRKMLALAATASLAVTACSASATPSPSPSAAPPSASAPASVEPSVSAAPSSAAPKTYVRVQLQWVPQAQFAGEFAAVAQGFYDKEGLSVTLLDGGPNVIPQQVGSGKSGPEFTLAWVPKVLQARESGSDLVDIAQIFQRSGTRSVSWKDSNITSPADFKGKKVGVWDFGNEFEVTAGALKAGLVQKKDYTKVIQPFDMSLLLNKQIDVAEAMIYNEYAQVLEATNPATGDLYKPEDLNVIDYNAVGTAMLQDAIFARAGWLSDPAHKDTAVKFLKATFEGWIYCRDHPDDCVGYVLAAGPTLGKGHQAWQLNEVNPLIWPSPNGIGQVDPAAWTQTVQIAKDGKVLTKDPDPGAVDMSYATQALSQITGDTKGTSFTKGTVQVTKGGE
jgi:NitT/TauT family transport system substrate-binding protein